MTDFDELWNHLVDTLEGWASAAVAWAPRLVVALLIVALFALVARWVRKGVLRATSRTRMTPTVSTLAARFAQFAVVFVGLMVVLSVLQLEGAVTSVLAGAGVVGLALGFAFQDLAANLISGVGLSVRHPFRRGDVIETNDLLGVAEEVRLRTTVLRTFDGKLVILPNKKIFQEALINHSSTDQRRVDVACGVSYDTDLEHAKETALKALGDVGRPEREPELFFEEFGDSSINFTARVWIDFDGQRDYLAARDEVVRKLKSAFDDEGIDIPFPIRTLELGDGVAESLSGLRSDGSRSEAPRSRSASRAPEGERSLQTPSHAE